MKHSRHLLLPLSLLSLLPLTTATAQVTTADVQLAPDYDNFVPPVAPGSYVDPAFGSTIKRITNALTTPNADRGGNLSWIENEYATMSAFNSDNSKFILVHESYFALYDGAGTYLNDLPLEINSSSEPRWSRVDQDTLYYHFRNQLKSYNTANGTATVVHTFSNYSSISGNGEMDISLDGDHFVFAGDNRFIFVYQISNDRTFGSLDASGHNFDSIYITPDNNVTVTWLTPGTARYMGIELFDINMSFQRQVAHAGGHMDVTRDSNGDEVLVWTNSGDPQPIPNCNNGIVKIRLADASQTCLTPLDWSLAVHISAPDGNGTVFVDTEAPANPVPNGSGWVAYTGEILQIQLDGSSVTRLAHHRSRPSSSYVWQPKLSTSRDGSRLLFASNFDLPAMQGYAPDYADTYMMVLGAAAIPPATEQPPTESVTPGPVHYEQDDASVEYSGTWFPNHAGFNSGSSAVMTMDAGSEAKFTFTGTSVKWVGFRDAWSGTAKVYVDGVLKTTIDTYSDNEQAQAVEYSIGSLTNDKHTLAIVATGRHDERSGGAWVWVDAFDITH